MSRRSAIRIDGQYFSAWIGLVSKQHSSGGKDRLGSLSRQGDRYLRSPFAVGELALIPFRRAGRLGTAFGDRLCVYPVRRQGDSGSTFIVHQRPP
ncbi:transposase [Bradyrhizobium sp.]|uniref:transposase n=1 Tax=Bradyrhizobium sp. TaxID=376 RepID=UPI003BB0C6C6